MNFIVSSYPVSKVLQAAPMGASPAGVPVIPLKLFSVQWALATLSW